MGRRRKEDKGHGREGGGRASIQSGFGLWLAADSSGVDNELEQWLVRLEKSRMDFWTWRDPEVGDSAAAVAGTNPLDFRVGLIG